MYNMNSTKKREGGGGRGNRRKGNRSEGEGRKRGGREKRGRLMNPLHKWMTLIVSNLFNIAQH